MALMLVHGDARQGSCGCREITHSNRQFDPDGGLSAGEGGQGSMKPRRASTPEPAKGPAGGSRHRGQAYRLLHGGDGWLHGKKPRVRAGLRRHAKRVAKRRACSSHITGTTNGQATAAKRPRTAWRPPNSEDERVIREVLPALCSAIRLLKASPKSHRFCKPLFRQQCAMSRSSMCSKGIFGQAASRRRGQDWRRSHCLRIGRVSHDNGNRSGRPLRGSHRCWPAR